MRPKATWDPELHRVFVDLCVEQTMLGNKPGTHFNKEGWKHIWGSFQEKTGAGYDRMQLKNHWDTMGRQWKTWCRLVQCSYMKWDPETNTFGASDEDWANYLQANPEAGQYRLNPPPHLEKLEIIFAGNNIDVRDDEVSAVRKRPSSDNEEDDTGGEDEQSMSCSLGPQAKGYWSQSSHELFVDLCVQETLKGNRPDTHFTKEAWKTILETINEKSGICYTRAQLKNHWDCTRKAWKIWCKLIGTSIMKWDPDTLTFGASEEEWQSYIRENPRAGQFRHKQVPHGDKLAIIFHGVISPGQPYTPQRKRFHRHSALQHFPDPTPLSVLPADEAATPSPDGEEVTCTALPLRLDGGFAESPSHEDEQTPTGREVAHRFDHESPVSVQMASGKLSYSIGECIECLDAMEEVEQGSDLYLFALDLFLKKEYREIFLQLKKPNLRIAWLQRLQSVGPSTA